MKNKIEGILYLLSSFLIGFAFIVLIANFKTALAITITSLMLLTFIYSLNKGLNLLLNPEENRK